METETCLPEVSPMTESKRTKRCMVCAKESEFEGAICPACQALIRGEALEKNRQIRKDADRELHKEGSTPEKKK